MRMRMYILYTYVLYASTTNVYPAYPAHCRIYIYMNACIYAYMHVYMHMRMRMYA